MSRLRPFVTCLCPSYRRPTLLANAIQCFLDQDYPAELREMIICDDSGRAKTHEGNGWRLISIGNRMSNLSTVFNSMANIAKGRVFFVWEDDDVYLPWHISSQVAVMMAAQPDDFILNETVAYSKPSTILTNCGGTLHQEPAGGRFHSSMAFTKAAWSKVGGWPNHKKPGFDLELIQNLEALKVTVDPIRFSAPSFVYRWEAANCAHVSGYMTRGQDDETWYDRHAAETKFEDVYPERITPKYDQNTLDIFKELKVKL